MGAVWSQVAEGPDFRLCWEGQSGSTQGFWLGGADTQLAGRARNTRKGFPWLFLDARAVSPQPLWLPDPEVPAMTCPVIPLLSQHCEPLPLR